MTRYEVNVVDVRSRQLDNSLVDSIQAARAAVRRFELLYPTPGNLILVSQFTRQGFYRVMHRETVRITEAQP
jgi:hypothetical protein